MESLEAAAARITGTVGACGSRPKALPTHVLKDMPSGYNNVMDEEELDISQGFSGKHFANTAGQVAASAVLATSLVAVLSEPPRPELVSLPEPVPIVQMYSPYVDEVEPAETDDDDDTSNRWRRILKLLKYLAIALLLAGALLFGALKGCTACSAGLLLPPADEQEEEQEQNQLEAENPQLEASN